MIPEINLIHQPAILSIWTGVMPLLTLKVTILLAAVAILSLPLRTKSAATRHRLWALAFAAALALPILGYTLPAWQPAWLAQPGLPAAVELPETTGIAAMAVSSPSRVSEHLLGTGAYRAPREAALPVSQASLSEWLLLVWALGVCLALAALVTGLVGSRWIAGQGIPIQEDEWKKLLRETAERLGVRRSVRLIRCDRISIPAQAGILFPVVMIPQDAERWPEERRREALAHELAHVQRLDCLTQLVAELVCAIHWFNPLVWWASRQLRIERERACDDCVLQLTADPAGYARNLLETARTYRAPWQGLRQVLTMAGPSQIERRLLAILDTGRNRRTVSRRVSVIQLASVAAILCLLAPLQRAALAGGNAIARLGENSETGLEEIRIDLQGSVQSSSLANVVAPLDMALIPAGTFVMGSTQNVYGNPDKKEWPPHQVTISKPFYIGKYELTQAQWGAVMGRKLKSEHFTLGPNYPAAKISWSRAVSFIKKLNRLGFGKFRLPTEAEWEYACRGGEKSLYYFGSGQNAGDPYMWWEGNYTSGGHHRVGEKSPNGWGLYDMHGNVSEWCSDVWEDPSPRGPQVDPQGPSPRLMANPFTNRVFRGIAYKFSAIPEWRFTSRHREQQADTHHTIGMRLVREYP